MALISVQYKSAASSTIYQSITHKHYFFPPSVCTEAARVCVRRKVNFITFVTALLFPPLSGWMIQWLQFLYTVQTEAEAIISQRLYSSTGQRMRFKPVTMQTCVALECVRFYLFRPQHCKNTCTSTASGWQRSEGRIWLKKVSYFTFFHESAERFWFRTDDIIAQKASLSDWWRVH